MSLKKYQIRFFQGNVAVGQSEVSKILQKFSEYLLLGNSAPTILDGITKYQLRELISLNGGASFKGVFAKFRDDAPQHIAKETGAETAIMLNVDEHIIEKNYFLYQSSRELLIYQTNFSASDSSRLASYLTSFAAGASTISFSDVLRPDALQELLAGKVKSVEVGFARPKKIANFAHETDWSKNMMRLLSGSGAGTITVKVSTRSKKQALAKEMKDVVTEFLQLESTRSLKVRLEGVERPIDLMAECIKDKMEVAMVGLYPNPLSIYAELEKAKDRQQEDLDKYFI